MGWLYFISILGWALLLMILLPKLRIGHSLLCSICGMLFLSFYLVIGLVLMTPTAYILIYGGLAGAAIGLLAIAADWRGVRSRLSFVPLLVYILGCAVCIILTQNAVVAGHDDMSYWMRIVKELYLFERFPIHGDSTMFHSDYIPLLASQQYCLMRIFGWQDQYALYVTFAVLITSIAAIAESVKKAAPKLLVSLLLLLAVPCVSFGYFTVRSDLFMGMLFGAGTICFFIREDNEFSSVLPSLCASIVLTGFKIYSGLLFAVVLSGSMLISSLSWKKEKHDFRILLTTGILALSLSLFLHFTWSALYNYHEVMASYESAMLQAEYTGVAFTKAKPVISLSLLLQGNPRNRSLSSAFSQETIQKVGTLIADTFTRFIQSSLPLVLVALVLAIVIALMTGKQKNRNIAMLSTLMVGYIIYMLGLFGTYFVQAETAPASNTYLATSSLPILMASALLAVTGLLDCEHPSRMKKLLAVCMFAIILVLCPLDRITNAVSVKKEPEHEAAFATEFYTDVISDQIYETDMDKRALLIDCSYEAAEHVGNSGKTHAYQYYALPMRTIVKLWHVEDYTNIDQASWDYLIPLIESNRCELLILRIDDDVYWYTLMDELMLTGDNDSSIGVYDIVRDEDGNYSFIGRMND